MVFASNRIDGIQNIYMKAINGTSQDEPLYVNDLRKIPVQWSRDGRFVIYTELDPRTRADLWYLPMDNGKAGKPGVFLHSEANEMFGQLSPDDQWMAYTSDESGRREVYIRSFPSGEDPTKISIDGGEEARWKADGKELFFISADGKMMSVSIKSGTGARASIVPSWLAAGALHGRSVGSLLCRGFRLRCDAGRQPVPALPRRGTVFGSFATIESGSQLGRRP